VHTSGQRVTPVTGAGIVIVAKNSAARGAKPVSTDVIGGACVTIRTSDRVGQVGTAAIRITTVIGTGIDIIADQTDSCGAHTIRANISQSTTIPIITGFAVEIMGTAEARLATIISAGVCITTVGCHPCHAVAIHAFVIYGAGITVLAKQCFMVGCESALAC